MKELSQKDCEEFGVYVTGGGLCPACYYGYFLAAVAVVGYGVTRFQTASITERVVVGAFVAGGILGTTYVRCNQTGLVPEISESSSEMPCH